MSEDEAEAATAGLVLTRAATCDTCPFYEGSEGRGVCRAKPPTILPGSSQVFWPKVARTDWCGEHPLRRPIEAAREDDTQELVVRLHPDSLLELATLTAPAEPAERKAGFVPEPPPPVKGKAKG